MRLLLVTLLPLAMSTSPEKNVVIEQIKTSAIANPPLRFIVEIQQLVAETSTTPEVDEREPSWQQFEAEGAAVNETSTTAPVLKSPEMPRIHNKANAVLATTSTPHPTLQPHRISTSAPSLELSSTTLPTQSSSSSPPTSSSYNLTTSSPIVIPPIFYSMTSPPAASPFTTPSSKQPEFPYPTLRPSKIFSLFKDAVSSPSVPSNSFKACPCACPRYSVATNADARIAMQKGDYFYLMVNSLSPPRQRRECCTCAGDKAGWPSVRKHHDGKLKPAANAVSAVGHAPSPVTHAVITNGPFARRKVDALREVAKQRAERSATEHNYKGISLLLLSALFL